MIVLLLCALHSVLLVHITFELISSCCSINILCIIMILFYSSETEWDSKRQKQSSVSPVWTRARLLAASFSHYWKRQRNKDGLTGPIMWLMSFGHWWKCRHHSTSIDVGLKLKTNYREYIQLSIANFILCPIDAYTSPVGRGNEKRLILKILISLNKVRFVEENQRLPTHRVDWSTQSCTWSVM